MNDIIEKQLPEGWAYCRLPDTCEVIMGQSPPGKTYNKDGKGMPFFQGKTEFGDKFPKVRKWCTAPNKIAFPGDILMSIRAPVGPTNVANQECAIGRGLAAFRPLGKIPTDYLVSWIRLNEDSIAAKGTGSTFTAINRSHINEIPVKLAPLAEQNRIADKVQKLLDRVNEVKSRLEKVPKILKRFRQSVLSAAITGKLTEDWRKKNNKDNGKDCLNVIDIELPAGWKTEMIKNFTSKVGSGATPRGGQKVYNQSGTPLIRSQNVYIEGFTEDGLVYLTKKHADELQNVEVNAGDVLLNITGASIGRVTTAPDNMAGARVNQHVCIIRPEKLVSSDLLSIFLASPEMQNFIMKAQYGVTRQALTKGQILDFEIPIPPDPEQKEIMRQIDSLFVLTSKIEERLEHSSQYIKKITPSILAKAFRGELVPTEAELARFENRDYETAEQLLERIKSTQKKAQKKTRKPKIMKDVFVTNMAFMDIIQPIQDEKERITVTEFKTLYEIILNSKEGMTPEALLDASKYSIETIEAFYEELATLEKEGKIEDYRPNNRVSLLRVKK